MTVLPVCLIATAGHMMFENLYVVDASFMPRSGAINPSLTIAANALRVAPQIAAQLSNIVAQ